MQHLPHKHRWIVALPLVVACVVLTLREGWKVTGNLLAENVSVAVGDIALAHGTVRPDVGAEVTVDPNGVVQLAVGSILVWTPGFVTVDAGESEVDVWAGAAYITRSGDRLSVAALDVPVQVRSSLSQTIVPSLSQWTSTSLMNAAVDPAAWLRAAPYAPLPSSFVRDQQEVLASWTAGLPSAPTDLTAAVLAEASTEDIATWAVSAAPTPTLLHALQSRPTLAVYALVHPAVRDAAWTLFQPVPHPSAALWQSLLLFPRVSVADEPSEIAAEHWGDTLRVAIDAHTASGAVRTALLPLLLADVHTLAAEGHPIAALRMADGLKVAMGTGALETKEARDAARELGTITPDSLRASLLSALHVEPAAVSLEESVSSAVPADPALEAQARQQLTVNGAMFTAQSSIRTVGEGMVEVENVVFGLANGDRRLHFRYTVADETVQAMVDGAFSPYAVPFGQFLEWAGR